MVEEYLVEIENGEFSEEDLTIYLKSYDDSPVYKALGLFLRARLSLYEYDYKLAYEDLEA